MSPDAPEPLPVGAVLAAAPDLIASGLIPELCATYRKKNPACPFSAAQLDFLARCAIKPEWALAAHEDRATFAGNSVAVFPCHHPGHPLEFAICFRDSPEHFTRFLDFIRRAAPKKKRTNRRRARIVAGQRAVIELVERGRLPTADEIVAATAWPHVPQKAAEAARTEVARRVRKALKG